jgi:hypothetical protein
LHPRRIVIIVIVHCGLGLGCLSLLAGCGDESKTTGTQLQISPEVKAEMDDMKSAQKAVREERKQERGGSRTKGR